MSQVWGPNQYPCACRCQGPSSPSQPGPSPTPTPGGASPPPAGVVTAATGAYWVAQGPGGALGVQYSGNAVSPTLPAGWNPLHGPYATAALAQAGLAYYAASAPAPAQRYIPPTSGGGGAGQYVPLHTPPMVKPPQG